MRAVELDERHDEAAGLVPLLEQHDHGGFEIFCYSDVRIPDTVTQRLRGHADHWRSITGASDEQVAQRVREDGIDHIIFGGDAVILPILREQLPPALASKVVNELSIDISGSGNVSVLLGAGDGTFATFVDHPASDSSNPAPKLASWAHSTFAGAIAPVAMLQ